ncbi:hypothetical protein FRB90_007564 [Tulasnella sp. 427]|nr:hypothetical protein FRB90_007564 [Tulasnella sp. 427]
MLQNSSSTRNSEVSGPSRHFCSPSDPEPSAPLAQHSIPCGLTVDYPRYQPKMAELYLQDIPFSIEEEDLIKALTKVFHNPPFHDGHSQLMNFDVCFYRYPEDGGAHNGRGILTIPHDDVADFFMSMYENGCSRPALDCDTREDGEIGITFQWSRREPHRNLIRHLTHTPFIDFRIFRKSQERAEQLSLLVTLNAMHLGCILRDGSFSSEWICEAGSDIPNSAFDRPRLTFNDDADELWFSFDEKPRGFETTRKVVAVPFRSVKTLNINTSSLSKPSVLLAFYYPPAFEAHVLEEDGFQDLIATRRDRLDAFSRSHIPIAPYASHALRITLDDHNSLRFLLEMAHIAHLPKSMETLSPTFSQAQFARQHLQDTSEWIQALDWIVAFQAQALINNLLLLPRELLELSPAIMASLEQSGSRIAAEILRAFAARLKGLRTTTGHDGVLQCFAQARQDINQLYLTCRDHSADPGTFDCYHATVTPTRVVLDGPYPDRTNRVLREYPLNQDSFLRVSFTDEEFHTLRWSRDVDGPSFVRHHVGGILKRGLEVAGRHFDFLAYSNSALRDHSVWFCKEFTGTDWRPVNAHTIRNSLGDFSELEYQPAKCAARMAQAFSATEPSVTLEINDKITTSSDIVRNGSNFTDGVGDISGVLADRITERLEARTTTSSGAKKLRKRFRDVKSSVFQFRLGGYKGIIAVDYRLAPTEVNLRKSQRKFWASTRNIEIVQVCNRARSYTLVGVADIHGWLPPNTIFAHIRDKEKSFYVEGRVLITRSPQVHPGDLQYVDAIGKPPPGSPFDHEPLTNCIVFSTQGTRSIPSMLAGGDLDGDEYSLILDKRVYPTRCDPPAEYPPAEVKYLKRPVDIEDIADWVVEYINSDILGMICSQFLRCADLSPQLCRDPDCILLAELASKAVDFAKSGTPVEWTEVPKLCSKAKPDWNAGELSSLFKQRNDVYVSQRAVGKLFRMIDTSILERLSSCSARQTGKIDRRSQASQEPLHKALLLALEKYIDVKQSPAPEVALGATALFHAFTTELRYISASHSLTELPLTEEEILVGTIAAKTHQPRKRQALTARMRSQTEELVKRIRSAILGNNEDEHLEHALLRGCVAWHVSTTREEEFGATSFGFIALGAVFETMGAIDERNGRK